MGRSTVSPAQAGSRRTSLAIVIAALLCPACAEPVPRSSRVVSEEFSMIVPLLDDAEGAIAANLIYEGNNALLRAGSAGRNGDMDGSLVARRWRAVAERTRAIFVLRDSLWSQQDHPTRHRPVFLMLPPSWLVVAAMKKDPQPVVAFDLEDDAAWTALHSPADMFGSYPPSYWLFSLATHVATDPRHVEREIVLSARSSLIQLSDHTTRLQQAAAEGWRAMVSEGAEIIAEGDRAYFGEKDLQQLAVVRRMVADRSLPIEIIGVEIQRESDGLAISSRNQYLSNDERQVAAVLNRALRVARQRIGDGDHDSAVARAAALRVLELEPAAKVDYLQIVGADDIQPVETITEPVRAAGAIWIGQTRLIDNVVCEPAKKARRNREK